MELTQARISSMMNSLKYSSTQKIERSFSKGERDILELLTTWRARLNFDKESYSKAQIIKLIMSPHLSAEYDERAYKAGCMWGYVCEMERIRKWYADESTLTHEDLKLLQIVT